MTLCKVIGTLVATQKNEHLRGQKILIVQPIDLRGTFIGRDIIALDSVDAGVGDTVLIIQEGQGAAQVVKNKKVPVHSVIVAVVDGLEVLE
ncbi:MAG: EutN/CcmL family microcompartment protein [Ignavibacteria bacterium]|nr:EutN/CcmL family microcompartment protein [Ignavibacteria bacterium]MBI3765491.1 EutN/CcmL family microcompartment protein [Ignavibacteriales bacterium]